MCNEGQLVMKRMNNINIAMINVCKNNNITCSRINHVICVDVIVRTWSVQKSCVDLRECSSFTVEVVSTSLDVPAFQEASCGGPYKPVPVL